MEFQFLGTSSGTPSKTRNVTGLALRGPGGGWSLVDCGEGTQHRILHTTLSLHDLRAVFVTHLHGDHCYGLPGLLASAGMQNRTAPLTLVGPPPLWTFIEGVMATTGLGLPYPLAFVPVADLAARTVLPDLAVDAIALSHRMPSYAFRFTERAVERKLDTVRLRAAGIAPGPAWGELQRGLDAVLDDGRVLRAHEWLLALRKARTIVVGGDNDDPDLLLEAARTADVLVHEATYTEEVLRKVGPGPMHSSALRVARMAARAGVPNLVLTHFSPRYQDGDGPLSMAALEAEARGMYGGQLFLARDFDRYVLERSGLLRAG
ncbi:MBL fold metallo-hydrolase [Massilia sp. Root335]|uniref:MBL fold metallo-hydrolase n=1 Tax=Massilia sp. Root335 TaxID=1736517 RepID=UPI000700B2A7|nr:MBL fold metallo-hydrolase [Massilia sp. Root335]KQV43219.1 MBL fold metallo-hydrolase [Massilia sp. Root335]